MHWNPGFADLSLTCSVPLLDCSELQLLPAGCSNSVSQVGIGDLEGHKTVHPQWERGISDGTEILLCEHGGPFVPQQRGETETCRGLFQPNFFYDYLPDLQGTSAVDVTDQPWALCSLCLLEAAL